MWKNVQAIPVVWKILIVVLVLAAGYRLTHLYRGAANLARRMPAGASPEQGSDARSEPGSGMIPGAASQSATESGAGEQLAQFRAQQSQLMARVYQCEQAMTDATNQMAAAAMRGQMVNNRPLCEQYMPQWTAQEAYLETEIYRIQTGDTHSTVRQITGIAAGSGSSDSPASSGRSREDGTGAVEDWDRGAIRGTSIYTDAEGQQHELPTKPYYFRDRASGAIVGSDQPYAPNDGGDYEQLQEGSHPQ